MEVMRQRNRRSFLAQAIGSAVAGAAALVLGKPVRASQGRTAERRLRVDADPSDPAHSGLSDSDSGTHSDPSGNGRGGRAARRRGISDADSGANADPDRRGRGPARRMRSHGAPGTRCSDSDSGPEADPGGQGRRCGGRRTGLTDSDPSDPVGRGSSARERWINCPGHRRCPR